MNKYLFFMNIYIAKDTERNYQKQILPEILQKI